MEVEKILLRRRDAADALGLSLRALDYLVSLGKIRPRRIGKRVLFSREELQRFASRDQAHIVPESGVKR